MADPPPTTQPIPTYCFLVPTEVILYIKDGGDASMGLIGSYGKLGVSEK